MPKMVQFDDSFKPEACGQTVLPDRSVLIGQKMVENAKIKKNSILINWLIFLPGILQTCLQRHSFCFVDYESSYKRSKQFFNIKASSSGAKGTPGKRPASRHFDFDASGGTGSSAPLETRQAANNGAERGRFQTKFCASFKIFKNY